VVALGRHLDPVHDPRSRAFPATVAPLVSVRHAHHGPVLDQGTLSSCTGNAAAQALNHEPLLVKGRRLLTEADAVAIYSWATSHDPYPGAFPTVDTGSDGLSVAKALKKSLHLISSYSHAFGLDHTLGALAQGPVIIGVPWLSGMFTPGPDGRLPLVGSVAGGHEVCLDQLDVENQRVWLLNSWSNGWGQNGRAWLSWSDLGHLLDQRGDATVLHP
jgi:hypothetical protein